MSHESSSMEHQVSISINDYQLIDAHLSESELPGWGGVGWGRYRLSGGASSGSSSGSRSSSGSKRAPKGFQKVRKDPFTRNPLCGSGVSCGASCSHGHCGMCQGTQHERIVGTLHIVIFRRYFRKTIEFDWAWIPAVMLRTEKRLNVTGPGYPRPQ